VPSRGRPIGLGRIRTRDTRVKSPLGADAATSRKCAGKAPDLRVSYSVKLIDSRRFAVLRGTSAGRARDDLGKLKFGNRWSQDSLCFQLPKGPHDASSHLCIQAQHVDELSELVTPVGP
jgi:hypothetical protein